MTLRPSDRAWITMGLGIALWDAVCPPGEMLSEASARYMQVRPVLTGAVILYVAIHLMGKFPSRIDPLGQLGSVANGLVRTLKR